MLRIDISATARGLGPEKNSHQIDAQESDQCVIVDFIEEQGKKSTEINHLIMPVFARCKINAKFSATYADREVAKEYVN